MHPGFHDRVSFFHTRYPTVMSYLRTLNALDITWLLYGSAAVWLLTGSRVPNDIDIVVSRHALNRLALLRPEAIRIRRDSEAQLRCGDGLILNFPAYGLMLQLDGVPVEIMASGMATGGSHTYDLSLTPLAITHGLTMGALHISNPFDVMAIKAIMQRGVHECKYDQSDIVSLASVQHYYNADAMYVRHRGIEMGLDARVYAQLQIPSFKVVPSCECEQLLSMYRSPSTGSGRACKGR